ncbi:OsmC family protein [Arthrobacter sp. CJ23]|uniref:OsmC family protein n=1 Tax=Arthrobacter sp. CJ23 TaxID=2972479 RepID=UPI00215C3718|nr:OsmC family protein [Arthrobacter sp. CJ23]UVJ41278.1 OsmC family protein [Arthrobacter sp. CJ23]
MATTATIRNGIDVDRLLDTIHGIQADPAQGSFTFKASSTWRDGTHNTGQILGFTHAGQPDTSRSGNFTLEGDEPPVLLGNNAGPNAVELLLQALGFCYAVGYAANAAAQGIELSSLEFEVEGDIDVRRFLGVDGPRAGFTAIRAHARVSSPNGTPEQLRSLCQYVQDTSPVRDSLANPVPVETTLEIA